MVEHKLVQQLIRTNVIITKDTRGHIFSHVRPFYERAVSNHDRSMHRFLWVYVIHSSFIEGSHMTKNTASEQRLQKEKLLGQNLLEQMSFEQTFLRRVFAKISFCSVVNLHLTSN